MTQNQFVKITPLSSNEWNEALCFIEPYENECVELYEHLAKSISDIFIVQVDDDCSQVQNKKIIGVIYLRAARTILHCLPFTKRLCKSDVLLYNCALFTFKEFFCNKNIFCIIGTSSGSVFLTKAYFMANGKKKPSSVQKYILMQCNFPRQEVLTNQSGFVMRHATLEDARELFELEKNYQYEEVIPPSQKVTNAYFFNLLSKILQEQEKDFFIIKNQERICAMARITAVGKHFAQIGGVYTNKACRKKGFAKTIVNHLVQIIYKKNMCTILFVKEKNIKARLLYKALGFKAVDNFLISYW